MKGIIPVNFKGVQQSGNGSVNVVVPPLHFQVVTATLNVKNNGPAIAAAQNLLENTLSQLDQCPRAEAEVVLFRGRHEVPELPPG